MEKREFITVKCLKCSQKTVTICMTKIEKKLERIINNCHKCNAKHEHDENLKLVLIN